MKRTQILILVSFAFNVALSADKVADSKDTGVLLLAHGHKEGWNRQVRELARRLPFPVAVAFGMAHKTAIAEGLAVLEEKGVRNIVVVPLYVSSYSPIIRASAYLLGLTREAPPELATLNSMRHGLQDPHAGHGGNDQVDLSPIRSHVPIRMSSALDDHPLVAQILLDRAKSISKNPEKETVILVGHGPNSEADNKRWLEKMSRLADYIRNHSDFYGIEIMTIMDDAPGEVRERATVQLRARVEAASRSGTALVVPVLLSRGGVEVGLQQRLLGLRYRMPRQFLLPDPRIAEWVKQKVRLAIQATDGHGSTVTAHQSIVISQRSTVISQRSTVNSQQSTVNGQ